MPVLIAPYVSALTAGVLIILQMLLLLATAQNRRRARQALGEGDDDLIRAVRRHGNFAENAAIFLICVALYEMLSGERGWVEVLCAVFLAGRLLHAIGLSMRNTVNLFRVLGIVLTVAASVIVGLRLVMIGVTALSRI